MTASQSQMKENWASEPISIFTENTQTNVQRLMSFIWMGHNTLS